MSYSIGTSGRIDFQPHADHLITGDFSYVGWYWISAGDLAGQGLAQCSAGLDANETLATNTLWRIGLGTKNAGGHRFKLKYLHETGAGVDTTYETTGEFHCNSWAPVIVTRSGTTLRVITPFFNESTTLADLPATSATTASYVIGGDNAGNNSPTSSFVQNTMLWTRALNDSEIASILCGYASNSTNFGTTNLLYANNLISAATTQAGSGGGTPTAEGTGDSFDSFDLSLTSSGAVTTSGRTLHLVTAVPTSNNIAAGSINTYKGTSDVSVLNASGLPNPTNCYAEDATTSSQACAQNNGYINFFDGFDLSAVPSGVTAIGAYTHVIRKASTSSSGWFTFTGLWESQSGGTGANQIGSSIGDGTEPTVGLVSLYRWWYPSLTQLRNGTLAVIAGHGRNGSLAAVTGDIDAVTITAVYTDATVTTVSGVGAASGTGTATGVGVSTALGVGAATGTGTATGIGGGIAEAVGAATGAGTAAAISATIKESAGAATGAGTALGVSSATTSAVGIATGTGTALGVGGATVSAVGLAAGAGDASGIAEGGTHLTGVRPLYDRRRRIHFSLRGRRKVRNRH